MSAKRSESLDLVHIFIGLGYIGRFTMSMSKYVNPILIYVYVREMYHSGSWLLLKLYTNVTRRFPQTNYSYFLVCMGMRAVKQPWS